MRLIKTSLALVLSLVLLSVLTRSAGWPFGEVLGNLIFGWAVFLWRVGGQVSINWNAVATAAVCLGLIYIGLQWFLRWLARAVSSNDPAAAPIVWKLRWTSALVGMFLLMFVAGLAFIGIVHQSAWLARSKEPGVERRVYPHKLLDSRRQLMLIGLEVGNYEDVYKRLPPQAFEEKGYHSWQTATLVGLGQYRVDNINYALPWDHPQNKPAFAMVVPTFINPDIAPYRNAEGYALSHYAGNLQVLGNPQVSRLSDVKDGISNTLLAGEVAANFKPWGDPTNLRDASTGLNATPDGFGGPGGEGALLLMLDGSVKFYSKATSPQVLKSLGLPNDGR